MPFALVHFGIKLKNIFVSSIYTSTFWEQVTSLLSYTATVLSAKVCVDFFQMFAVVVTSGVERGDGASIVSGSLRSVMNNEVFTL